jgi:hypothetical protein
MTHERDAKSPLHFEDMTDHEKSCAEERKDSWWKVVGILVAILSIAALPIFSFAITRYQSDARQDEQIKALQRTDDLMREDLQEMKADIKYLVQEQRKRQ